MRRGTFPSPPAAFLASLVAQQAFHVVVPGPTLLPFPLTLVGVPLLLAGAALHHRAWRHFRSRGAPLDTLAAPPALVVDGPFVRSRNPMYLAGVVILAGAAALYGSLTPWLVPPVFALVAVRLFVAPEERLLAGLFGDEYARYRLRAGRWYRLF